MLATWVRSANTCRTFDLFDETIALIKTKQMIIYNSVPIPVAYSYHCGCIYIVMFGTLSNQQCQFRVYRTHNTVRIAILS